MMLRGVFEYLRTMTAHNTAFAVQRKMSMKLYEHIIALGPAHFNHERTGGVINSLVDGVGQLETYFGEYIPQLIVAAVTPILIFCFAIFLDFQIAIILLVASLFTLLAPMIFHRYDRKNSLSRSKAYKAFSAEFLDSLQGLSTLKAFGQSGEKIKTLSERAYELFRTTMWVLATNSLSRGITDIGITIGTAIALAFGAFRVAMGEMELQILLILLMLGTEIFKPLRDLRALLHNGMVGQSAALGIFEILDSVPLLKDRNPQDKKKVKISPSIEFKNVKFSYPNTHNPVLNGLSFKINEGERIGIVGASGVGKSTILKLLLRIYDPDKGVIKVGGNDIQSLNLDETRNLFSVVSQDTYLFHGSIEENIKLGSPNATWAQIKKAASAANATEFINKLPEKYQTIIGERGIRLSGGQRQRIAIARALLRNAKVLLLDEALSSVDTENEALIQDALDRLMIGRTTMILAHRLSSIISSDKILVIENGAVCEAGNHKELMMSGGVYHNLMRHQAQNKNSLSMASNLSFKKTLSGTSNTKQEAPQKEEKLSPIVQAKGLSWKQAFKYLLQEVRPYTLKLFFTLSFGIGRIISYIGVGAISALAVASVKLGQPFENYIIILGLLAPLAGILHWTESWIAHDMAFRMLSEMRIKLFRKFNELAPAYLVNRSSGDLMSMATQDVEVVEYFFAHTIAPALVSILIPGAILIILSVFNPILALTLLPFLIFVAISPFLLRKHVDLLGSQSREALGTLNAHAVDTVQGLSEIISFQAAASRGKSFDHLLQKYHTNRFGFFKNLTIQTVGLDIVTGLGGLSIVLAGAVLGSTGSIDVSYLPLLTILAMAAFLPISEIAQVSRQLADTLGATRRLHSVHSKSSEVEDGKLAAMSINQGDIKLEHASFAYAKQAQNALDDLNLLIHPGKTLALVGPSGAGKTTLAHLLMRFWDPSRGKIQYGSNNLKEFKLNTLREKMALVSQDTYLFNASLRQNILLANPKATKDDLMHAINNASLGDFVKTLSKGLDTQVGERGMKLSGGQRQRVAIARAFLKDAPILILDEATSHLDTLSELSVHNSLKTLMNNRTTIIIAHRLSTIINADKIAVMQAGRIVEWGQHDTLIKKRGLYANLIHHQETLTQN